MPFLLNGTAFGGEFAQTVREKSAQPIELCYQCQKCAAGCPLGEIAGSSPNQILRLIQGGEKERVLQSPAIWLCLNCETCSARCPNGISISEVMDVLREMAFREGAVPGDKFAPVFHRLFLQSVKTRGRVQETMMMAAYKLKSGDLFSDLLLGLKMFQKGKLPLFTPAVQNKNAVRRIFARTIEFTPKGESQA